MEDYAEASGVALEIPEDTLLNKSKIDIPMAEFWVHALHPESMYYVDVRGAASAAHVYGKPIVATESFTGGGYESPFTLKKIADYWFAQGVNRLVFHTSAQQPLDTPPGNTMVGTHINRNITWAEEARPFMDYVARVSYMLQQGTFVADLAYLLPEGAPSTMPFWGSGLKPAPPPGYDYDYINTDILLHHTNADPDGIHLDSGMTYRVLVLPPTQEMTPEVLRRLHELVAAGAIIMGPRPEASPSLEHYPNADDEVHALATDLWGDTDGIADNQHHFGKGTVYSGLALNDLLARLHIEPDFAAAGYPDQSPAWIHRHLADGETYFVANQSDQPAHIEVRLRATGSNVQVWRPMDGTSATASAAPGAIIENYAGNRQPGLQPATYNEEPGFTTVQLDLAARESVFVVLRNHGQPPPPQPSPTRHAVMTIPGPWTVTFPPHLGAPTNIRLEKLNFWTANSDPGVKFFSGTATYSTIFTVPASALRVRHLTLHLDDLRDIAQIRINGKTAGLTWAPPYDINVTGTLHHGSNKLEIAVTNEWTNRIIGDRGLPANQRVLPGVPPARFGPPPALPDSGLSGNITLFSDATR